MPKPRQFLDPASLSLLVLTGVATILALLAPLGWPFELFAHFRAQYAAAALILVPFLLRARRPRCAALAAVLALFHLWPAIRSALADDPVADCGGPVLTVVTANVHYRNDDPRRFIEWLRAHPADLVVVQEVTAAWARELASVPGYPHKALFAREDPYGIGILSRWPLASTERVDFAGDGLPSLVARLEVGGEDVVFVGLHTHWPVLPRLARARDESLRQVVQRIRAEPGPTIVLGDLNLTPYSPVFRRLLDGSGLRDVMDGRRWRPTWLAGFWPLALRIDHVLVPAGVCVQQADVGPSIGSDHRPVIARLRLGAATAP